VLETAYANLAPEVQKLLSTVACFRGAVGYEALDQTLRVSETLRVLELDGALRELVDRGLLHRDRKAGKYDLHPIVRRYAYDRLSGEARTDAHDQLRDYFAAVPPPERVQSLDDLAPVIELYHHTVRGGQYDAAYDLFHDRLATPLYYQLGAYDVRIELLVALFPDGEDRPPRLKKEGDQAWTLNALANSYSLSGQPRRAVPLLEQQIAIREKQGVKQGVAIGLGNVAFVQSPIGALRAAEANLRRRIALCQEIEDEFREAIGHQFLGRLLAYRGAWADAEEELAAALALSEKERVVQSQCVVWAYRAQRALLLARWSELQPLEGSEPSGGYARVALSAARRALELADEWQRQAGRPNARDYVRAHWLLGAAHHAAGSSTGSEQALDAAERHLSEALTRCRGINAVDAESDILLDLAWLRHAQSSFDPAQDASFDPARDAHREEALRLAEEALLITERSGYVLQGADVHLFLAEIEIERGDEGAALTHAQKARELATCDGPPDYTYKVAYKEAGALLARLGAV
jgi:tetratricopeptide (TPR) repeat protein